ncbi:serine/threonine protein kinase [Inmirania thermothiophila]|uniref:Stress response kinase A n=1 Tax=Inmirania thermothiophila TaxID=1750597 RepID=A0A3N1Y7U3_9GAMM|nr:serine/threonine protein kinase [Inmirania thermothiophila]ROR34884.1 Ser/Thr protein kinase RdoA (MazF antagonist) [Inmirania thermothiophila]
MVAWAAMGHPYTRLAPDTVLDAVEAAGLRPDGRLLPLASYENRVYQVGLEDGPPVVAKFYRPGRWSDARILEEHRFARELAAAGVEVAAPMADARGRTLHRHAGFRFALWPRCGGRAPETGDPEVLRRLGRLLGRLHAVGAARPFRRRGRLEAAARTEAACRVLEEGAWIPADLRPAWSGLAREAVAAVAAAEDRAGAVQRIRLHGDLHLGNVLWRDEGPLLVDLDDACQGPAVQDLWMLLAGERDAREAQLAALLEGYETFRPFDRRELHLVEALRTARILGHAAWIARRWDDPAFPAAFPWFGTQRYWQDLILTLREQLAAMQEPPLAAA